MNLKKYLQQKADIEDEKILSEADILFIQQLAKETVRKYQESQKLKEERKKRKKKHKKPQGS